MGILDPQPIPLKRVTGNPQSVQRTVDDEKIGKLRKLLTGDDTLDMVRAAMINRYAQIIVEGRKETGDMSTELKRADSSGTAEADSAMRAAFNAGFFEITGLHMIKGIHEYRACIYDGKGMRWEYDKGPPKLADTMKRIRGEGGHVVGYQAADLYASSCNVSAVYFSTTGNTLAVDAVSLDNLWWYFADEIIEGDGEGRRRPVNKKRIDEASAVAIRIDGGDEGKSRWAVWFGESEDYPRGRHCLFTGATPWELPNPPWAKEAPPDGEVLDYTIDSSGLGGWKKAATIEEFINPLTWHRQEARVHDCPEYPIALMYGDSQGASIGDTANLGLYDISLEYDIAASVTLGAAQESALGKQVVELKDDTASGSIAQSVYSRLSFLNPGQSFKQAGWAAVNSKEAWGVALGQIRYISDSHHVPGFLVAPDWTNWPSGQAIRDAEHKLEKFRQKRINLNIDAGMQSRGWRIQKALINMSERAVKLGSEVVETFVPGDLPWPEDPEAVARETELKLKTEVFDLLDAMMRCRPEVETREQAINLLKERKKAAAKLGDAATVKLSVTDAPKFVTVNEARGAQGLAPLTLEDGTDDPDGRLTIAQFEAKQTAATAKPKLRDRVKQLPGVKPNDEGESQGEQKPDTEPTGKPGLLDQADRKPAA
jgi:hypothetical protein